MDFSSPGTVLEEPFIFPNFAPSYESPTVLRAHFSDDMESALVQMRSALLASASRARILPPERLRLVFELANWTDEAEGRDDRPSDRDTRRLAER